MLLMTSMFIVTVIIQTTLAHRGISYAVWYNSPTLLLCAMMLLEAVRRVSHMPSILEKASRLVSKYSFGIYLIHAPVLMILERYKLFYQIKKPVAVCVLFIGTSLVSFMISWIIQKNPILSKYILLK